ncbi:MAG: DUF167 domain-containing protein [Candidatus Terrybacteria bacterium]|nr:DUF167 domain-containing protein [Candidatus Terrybacteria bacterium]
MAKILVHAKANAKHERVEQLDASTFSIAVREPARENRANAAIARALADVLGVSVSRLRLASGRRGARKVFEVDE